MANCILLNIDVIKVAKKGMMIKYDTTIVSNRNPVIKVWEILFKRLFQSVSETKIRIKATLKVRKKHTEKNQKNIILDSSRI